MFIDVHAHLDLDVFTDLNDVIMRAEKAGVFKIISAGTDLKSNKKTLAIATEYNIIDASLGIYPLDGIKMNDEEFEQNLEFIKKYSKKIVALGDVGLDYSDKNYIDKQKGQFTRIIELAKKLNLPMIIHSRKAEEDVIDLLEKFNMKKIIMHSFSGNFKLVKKIEDNNWFFSIPCSVAYSTHFQKIVENISIMQLLTETDSPFLSRIKGERNEPMNVIYTTEEIAKIKQLDKNEVKKLIFMNYKNLFAK